MTTGAIPLITLFLAGCTGSAPPPSPVDLRCQNNTVSADVVALDVPLTLNRLGSTIPDGAMFALAGDVVIEEGGARLRDGLRPRPLTLRANVGQCVNITLTNRMADDPITLRIDGMQWRTGEQDGGSALPPGASATYTLYAESQGTFLLHSPESGQQARGLVGAFHVEPAGSVWYRSQITAEDLALASTPGDGGLPIIDYSATYPADHPLSGRPILAMRDSAGSLVYSDLTAVISGSTSFREVTAIYQDFGGNVAQAFADVHAPVALEGEREEALAARQALAAALVSGTDQLGINYGSMGTANPLIANRKGLGPMARCATCEGEDFALSAWVSGDPALLVDTPIWPGLAAAEDAVVPFPADPANVYHSYQGDIVALKQLYSGAGEAPVSFMAHPDASNHVLDPGVGAVDYLTTSAPGDVLFHSLSAAQRRQGMWAILRIHDVFEAGSPLDEAGRPAGRALPDGEIAAGTPIPAVVPIPAAALPPLPGAVWIVDGQVTWAEQDSGGLPLDAAGEAASPGFPFFIPGIAGSQPPQAPLSLLDDGGLPRHIVERTGNRIRRTDLTAADLTWQTSVLSARELAADGEPIEQLAMGFHEAEGHATATADGAEAWFATSGVMPQAGALFSDPCRGEAQEVVVGEDGRIRARISERIYKAARFEQDVLLTRSGLHSPQLRSVALWEDVSATLAGGRAAQPLILRAHSGDCVIAYFTTLAPAQRLADASGPAHATDTAALAAGPLGLDPTASVGGGWNYEVGAYSPDEVRVRIQAINVIPKYGGKGGILSTTGRRRSLRARSHPFFGTAGAYTSRAQRDALSRRWIGAQTVVQRWYVADAQVAGLYDLGDDGAAVGGVIGEPAASIWWDPDTGERLSPRLRQGQDRHPITLRVDGGPTSWQARIARPDVPEEDYRELALVLRSAPAYTAGLGYLAGRQRPAVRGSRYLVGSDEENASAWSEVGLVNLRAELPADRLAGSGTDTGDVDPTDPATLYQSLARTAFVGTAPYTSLDTQSPPLPRSRPSRRVTASPVLQAAAGASDPYTPMLEAYMGDRVRLVTVSDSASSLQVSGVRWWTDGVQDRQIIGGASEVMFSLAHAEEASQADHLYQTALPGGWGLLRAYRDSRDDLTALPAHPPEEGEGIATCPEDAPLRSFDVWAMSEGDRLVYVLADEQLFLHALNAPPQKLGGDIDSSGKRTGALAPMVLRARAGECVRVTLTNHLDPAALPAGTSAQVGLRPTQLFLDVTDDSGFNVGTNPLQTVPPGENIVYNWYAGVRTAGDEGIIDTAVELGAIRLLPADTAGQLSRGLIGALIIEPADAQWVLSDGDRTAAMVSTTSGGFQERVLVHLSEPDCDSINYQCDTTNLSLTAGEPARLRVLSAAGGTISLSGHLWPASPHSATGGDTVAVSSLRDGGQELYLERVGGVYGLPGSYSLRVGSIDGVLEASAAE